MGIESRPDLAGVAKAFADDSRAAMMVALMDGRAWTAGELAAVAGVARNTASEHLHRLAGAGLVQQIRQGRHRYVRLSDDRVATAIEALAEIAERRPASPSLRAQRADAELASGRSCYRHLAGHLGVALADEWRRLGVFTEDWAVTPAGQTWFARAHVPVTSSRSRPPLKPCIDWTARREHAAGFLADAFLEHALDAAWFQRGRHPRAIRMTPEGRQALGELRIALS